MSSVDFAEVKSAATVEQVIGFLGLKLTQKEDSFRGVCPLCKSGSREFVITGSKKLFHCFKCKKGGDMLKLVSEAKGIGVKEAAAELAKACGVEKKPTLAPTEKKAFDVDKYAEGLDPEHKALEPLGLSADTLRTWKAGYSATGVNRGRLALPIEISTARHSWLYGNGDQPRPTNLDLPERHRPAPLYLRRRTRDRQGTVSDTLPARRVESVG